MSCWKTFHCHMILKKPPQSPHLALSEHVCSLLTKGKAPAYYEETGSPNDPPLCGVGAEAYSASEFLKGHDFSSKLKIHTKCLCQSTGQQGPHQCCPRCTPHTSSGHQSPGPGSVHNPCVHPGHVLPTACQTEPVRSGQLLLGWRRVSKEQRRRPSSPPRGRHPLRGGRGNRHETEVISKSLLVNENSVVLFSYEQNFSKSKPVFWPGSP